MRRTSTAIAALALVLGGCAGTDADDAEEQLTEAVESEEVPNGVLETTEGLPGADLPTDPAEITE